LGIPAQADGQRPSRRSTRSAITLALSSSCTTVGDMDTERRSTCGCGQPLLSPCSPPFKEFATPNLLRISNTGAFGYTPNPGFIGADSFTYEADYGYASPISNVATVYITVTPIEGVPGLGTGLPGLLMAAGLAWWRSRRRAA